MFFISVYGHSPDLHSFPTRRSSVLSDWSLAARNCASTADLCTCPARPALSIRNRARTKSAKIAAPRIPLQFERSEEHTSELQSRFDLVCRLLLEKKNKTMNSQASTL